MASQAAARPDLVAFTCQKCSRSVEVDPEQPVSSSALMRFYTRDPLPAHLGARYREQEKAAMAQVEESFVVLSEEQQKQQQQQQRQQQQQQQQRQQRAATGGRRGVSQGGGHQDWDRRVRALSRVYEAASDKCAVDFPLCGMCANTVVKDLDARTVAARADTERFRAALDELRDSESVPPPPPEPGTGCMPTNELERERLEGLERQLLARLDRVRDERSSLDGERRRLEAESRALERLEKAFWQQHRAHAKRLGGLASELEATERQVEVATEQLNRLRRTNVYDDAFHVSYDGHFGTINGFRLGRLPSQPVPWEEFNAALGQVVLLLDTIARLCNFKFSRYTLTPLGSFSKIARNDDPSSALGLYGSSDLSFSKLLWYGRFDTALTWLLECVREFGEHAHSLDPSFKLGYDIKDGTIQGLSVKLQFNQDAKWTRALKYMLTSVKFLLAWTSKHKDH